MHVLFLQAAMSDTLDSVLAVLSFSLDTGVVMETCGHHMKGLDLGASAFWQLISLL